MSFPLREPGTKYLLAYEDEASKELCAARALCGLGDQLFEVYAFADRAISTVSGKRQRLPSQARA